MKIPLFEIYWEEDDIDNIKEVISSGMKWACGDKIEEFEKRIADYLGSEYCLVFNSGGTALHSLMNAYGFGPDDEIIVPSFTFIATAYAPIYVGAKPVFADIEKETFGLDPVDVEKKITPRTKALLPIHYGGMPCKIDELKKIAEDNDLILIEDAAESFGAKLDGELIGTFGDSSVFSFCQNKIFTTGEGGCVVTDNKKLYEKLKLIRSYGRVVDGEYFTNLENLDYKEIGHNYRLSTIQAALGISQINKVDKIIKLRKQKADYLNEGLKHIENLKLPIPPDERFDPVYQMYTIRVLDGKEKRDGLMTYLEKEGITTRIYFDPLHKYTIFKNLLEYDIDLHITEELSEQVLTLPLYPSISDEELDYIIRKVKTYFEKRG